MELNNHPDVPEKNEKVIMVWWISMKVIDIHHAKQVVVFCPGFPESKWYNEEIIAYIAQRYNVSCVYPQYAGTRESEGEFLQHNPGDDIQKVMQGIKWGKVITNSDAYITLVGSSFGWWVALSLSRNDMVDKVIALSPLTPNNATVDWEWLYTFLKEQRPEYKIDVQGYEKLTQGKLMNLPAKYPEGKVTIWAVQGDPEINFAELTKESLNKSAHILDQITLGETEKKHLSRSVLNRASTPTKEHIFKSLDTINERIHFIDLFVESVFEKKSKDEVSGILSHGSWLFKEGNPRDFDFILVLNEIKKEDIDLLKHIKEKFFAQWINDLDITLLYKDKLEAGWIENFNLSTHGSYYAEILGTAKTLYWQNPFTADAKKKN